MDPESVGGDDFWALYCNFCNKLVLHEVGGELIFVSQWPHHLTHHGVSRRIQHVVLNFKQSPVLRVSYIGNVNENITSNIFPMEHDKYLYISASGFNLKTQNVTMALHHSETSGLQHIPAECHFYISNNQLKAFCLIANVGFGTYQYGRYNILIENDKIT